MVYVVNLWEGDCVYLQEGEILMIRNQLVFGFDGFVIFNRDYEEGG